MNGIFRCSCLTAIVLLAGFCASAGAQTMEQPAPESATLEQPAEQATEQREQAEPQPLAAPQDVTPLPETPAAGRKDLLDTTGRTKLSLNGLYGFGFNSIDVGVTTGGDTVSISGGGGLGFSGQVGYGISSSLDLDFDLGVQISVLDTAVSNADGSFSRSYLLATLKFKRPTSDTGQFKIGVGVGTYMGGELDIDTSEVAGGAHTIISYKPALGFHATGEFERFVNKNVSFHVGGKIYFVSYEADEATVNGASVPTGSLIGDVRDFDGSGFDVMIGVSTYF